MTEKFARSRFTRSISIVGAARLHRTARLDFFGSVLLVCSLGVIAKLVQSLLAD